MTEPGIVIVGGGPAALSVARSYRKSGGDDKVIMVAREPHPPYNRPPLTKEFLRGTTSTEDLPLEAFDWYWSNEVDLRLAMEVTRLDTTGRTITLSDGTVVPYNRCVLATGSRPLLPPAPGIDDPGVCVVRTLEDSERLISAAARARDYGDGSFVVVGSGFIGCEAAASLAMLGLDVSILTLEDAPQIERLGSDAAREVSSWLEGLGITLRTGAEVTSIEREQPPRNGESAGFLVNLEGGESVLGCGVVVGAGATPNTRLAEDAGLRVDGGIVCDSSMRTSDPHVFAVGDVALAANEAAARSLRVEHWGDALGQGKVCGEVLAGENSVWRDVPGFWSTIGERTLKYAAWGDGWDEAHFVGDSDAFTVWYGRQDVCVGVLTHNHDEDYKRGRVLVGEGQRMSV